MKKFTISLALLLIALITLTAMGPSISGPTATVTDTSGKSVRVEGLTYNHAPFIQGKLGSADIRIELPKIRQIDIEQDEMVIQTGSDTLRILHGHGTFSGKTGFGSYTIAASQVRQITIER